MNKVLNSSLHLAKKNKEDEFYTQRADIDNELKHYKEHFKGKTIFCNCDDPYESNFFKYFASNFNYLELKKLIATCYNGSQIADKQLMLFANTQNNKRQPYKIVIEEVKDVNNDGAIDIADVEWLIKNDKNVLTLLKGDGDFRSEECIKLLKEADIVVTNPPFSLFREYVAQLIEYDKKFIIIGNQNAYTYKEIFKLIQEDKIWVGYKAGDMEFQVPDYYEPRATRYRQDKTGQKWRSMGNITWFTNLDIAKRHEDLTLYKQYNPLEYPKYDNYNAINVNKVADIPMDYDGVMGVPITFIDKYNPKQFEILNCNHYRKNNSVPIKSHGLVKDKDSAINGKAVYARILIKKR